MEKKINIAELLKDCPKDMELDCTMFENVSFRGIKDGTSQIMIHTPDGIKFLNSYGCYHNAYSAKCVIFPKGKTTWEGFKRPFKDGDIVSTHDGMFTAIVGKVISLVVEDLYDHNEEYDTYCHIYYEEDDDKSYLIADATPLRFNRLATEEEKERLFQAIKDNGYEWNAETKTLVKLIVPKFKVGDRIKNSNNCRSSIVSEIKDDCFIIKTLDGLHHSYLTDKLLFSKQDEYELVTDKFNINTLQPFDKVLVRGDVGQRWIIDFFGFMDNKKGYPFVCVGHYVIQCVPYEGNEHLLGTTDDCEEYYKNWK